MKKRWHYAIGVCIVFAIVFRCEAWCAQAPPRSIKPNSPAVTQWKAHASKIQKTLEESDEKCVGAPAVGIVDAFGLSSDTLSVALVNFCGRGAYTDSLFAMRMDHGKPVLARFRDAHGKRIEVELLSGASARHSVGAKLVPENKAIYSLFVENDSEGKPAQCGVKAYVWNAKSETFDQDLRLSKAESAEYCRSLREQ